ncbi:MAG: hypothetical protein ACK4YD_00440 [Chitinophagia bacterium]
MLIKHHMILLMLLSITSAKAQFARSPYVSRDPRLDKLVDKQIELNKEALKNRTVLEAGFRIVVISTNKRDLALEAKAKLMKQFPDQKTYLYYQSPNFKLQFGNFKAYKDAEIFRKEMTASFGENLLIIPAQIEVKPEKQENENRP